MVHANIGQTGGKFSQGANGTLPTLLLIAGAFDKQQQFDTPPNEIRDGFLRRRRELFQRPELVFGQLDLCPNHANMIAQSVGMMAGREDLPIHA